MQVSSNLDCGTDRLSDENEPTPSEIKDFGPGDDGEFYVSNKEDVTCSDIFEEMSTPIDITVDDQVHSLSEVRVIGLDNLLGQRRNDPHGGNKNADTDNEIVAPDQEGDTMLQLSYEMKSSPTLSRSTSLSSLTNEFYKVRDGIGNVAIAERWNNLATQSNEDEGSFDVKYTYSHPPSDATSCSRGDIDMGWPSLSSTQTPIEGRLQAPLAGHAQSHNHEYIYDVKPGPIGLDMGTKTENSISSTTMSMSNGFASFVYNYITRSSRKKKACIASVTSLFFALMVVAFVMGFSGPHAGLTNTGNAPGHETFENEQLPKRDNSSLQSIADPNDKVVLASVLSDQNDAEHDSNLLSQSTVATTLETESKVDEYNDIQDFEYVTDKDEKSTFQPLPTAAPTNTNTSSSDNGVQDGGLFDFDAYPSGSPLLFVSPSFPPILQPTTSDFGHSSPSPANKPAANPTQLLTLDLTPVSTSTPSAKPTPAPIELNPVPTSLTGNRQSLTPHNTEPTNLKPTNPKPTNPKPDNSNPDNMQPNNAKPDNPKPESPNPAENPPPTIDMITHPSISPGFSVSPVFTSSFPSPTNEPSQMWVSAQPSGLPPREASSMPTSLPSTRPSPRPSLYPTLVPTPYPQTPPTPEPTPEPTPKPTQQPTLVPSSEPTHAPTPKPTPMPTPKPTPLPTPVPTPKPTPVPTFKPTPVPTPDPLPELTSEPSPGPTFDPTPVPNPAPTQQPTPEPSLKLTPIPSSEPTPAPSLDPAQGSTQKPIPEPTPESMSKPTSVPLPEQTPLPTPEPTPESMSKPTPVPIPEQILEPTSQPTSETMPKPTPVPNPLPTPVPNPQPTPVPNPRPTPVPNPQPTPVPNPQPTPVPNPRPTPVPNPRPTPVPNPQPTPEPIPKSIECSARKFSYDSETNQCTNVATTGEFDTLEDCCEDHFGSYEDCEFIDACGI